MTRLAYGRRRSAGSTPGNKPTPAQLNYLAALLAQAGMTQEEWRDSVGLYETSAWGKRLRSEIITRSNVSRWISALNGNTHE